MFKTSAIVFALVFAASAANAADKIAYGPAVGAKIPHALTAKDQHGKAQSFETLRGARGLILLFNRSFDW